MTGKADQLSQALDVVGSFYDSILDNLHWIGACEQFADFCGGTATCVISMNPQTGTARAQAMRVDPHFTRHYEEHYISKDIRIPPAMRFAPGVVLTEDMLVTREELRRSEVYNEILLPAQVPYFMFSWFTKTPTRLDVVAVEGNARSGPFQAESMERYRKLMPHVARAIRARNYLEQVRQSADAAHAVLNALAYGVVFLDEAGLVLEASRPAEGMLERQEAIRVFKSCLRAVQRDEDERLQRAINRAVRAAPDKAFAGSTLRLSKQGCGAGITVYVLPLRSDERLLMERHVSALVLLVDPDSLPRSSLEIVQISLQLTHAEALLAVRLFRGDSLRDAAMGLAISVNTAKTQLKSIYSKTGCTRHAELVRKLMTLALAPRERIRL